MTPEQIVEATLFASQAPLTASELARADDSLTVPRVLEALQALRERYETEEHAFQLYQLADGYQLLTRPEFAPYLERFDAVRRPPALSRPAVETLAIVAYRQPIGRLEIEEIRGVGSATVLRTLQEWELIEVVERGEGLGRPLLYGTTRGFLDHFGLQQLSDLPKPEDLPVSLRAYAPVVEESSPQGTEAAEGTAAPQGPPARPEGDEGDREPSGGDGEKPGSHPASPAGGNGGPPRESGSENHSP